MSDKYWKDMDVKTTSVIHLNLSDEIIHIILEAHLAGEIRKKLKDLYMKKNLMNKVYLKMKMKIYSLYMKGNSDLLKHLNVFNMLNTQLSNFRVMLKEEDKATLLLASLPTSFDHFATTLM